MTKQDFLVAYTKELKQLYVWAKDEAKLTRFLAGVSATLSAEKKRTPDGPAVLAAWRAIGGKGHPTLKALRALDG